MISRDLSNGFFDVSFEKNRNLLYECINRMLLSRRPSVLSLPPFLCMSAKFALILFLFLYVDMCLNVVSPPCPTYMRPEPFVTCPDFQFTSILPLMLLCVCLAVYILSHIDLNVFVVSSNI